YFHYLIHRAQQQFPGKSAEAKAKAVNYLLPHIHRVPNRIVRDELAAEVAQRVGIDSAVLRQELKTAAGSRSQTLDVKAVRSGSVTPAEKILIHVLLERGEAAELARSSLVAERLYEGWLAESIIAGLLNASADQLAEPLALVREDGDRNR